MAATYALESAALRCWDTVSLLVSPEVAEFCRTKSEKYGVGLSGALFGVGAWIWLDAVATSPVKVPFSQVDYDPFGDEGVYCRLRSWLLAAYVVSFVAVGGAVIVMLHHFGDATQDTRWIGVACVLETATILGSALLFFVSRTPGEEGGYDTY
ncbi:hypothetical protein QBZ16_000932 [Prototheca wickerhamii]|uniref:Uncharacterized protein n=1 Tax=Prototheca wickerhamii TaxID=3111 RepID=A0AAD9IHU7_PROWI|nr:hypothetical protein QBZ16_000932 [Prototheca wickerhamii]